MKEATGKSGKEWRESIQTPPPISDGIFGQQVASGVNQSGSASIQPIPEPDVFPKEETQPSAHEATKDTPDYIEMIGAELEIAKQLHIKAKQEALTGKSYQKVLTELLSQINSVDFRERAGLGEDDKISRKLYVVISIDEILETATANDWGLCTKDGFIYVFNGKYWQVVNAEDFKPFLADAAIKMGVPVLEAKYHQFKDELYKQFLSASNLPTPER